MKKKTTKKIPFKQTAPYKSAVARVNKGIKFLDKTYGSRKWVEKIKLEIFRMADGNTCVIGQVFGGWGSSVTSEAAVHNGYILTEKQAAAFGFQSMNVMRTHILGFRYYNERKQQKEYDILQRVWKSKLLRIK